MEDDIFGLKVLLLRAETLVGHSFENTLRGAGHPVTVISSREAAFSLIDSMRPDLIVLDPISEFGFSGSVQRLCQTFDGPIVATGLNPESPMVGTLKALGISLFAENADELLDIARDHLGSEVQPPRAETLMGHGAVASPAPRPVPVREIVADDNSEAARPGPVFEPEPKKRFSDWWHWAIAGMATAAVMLTFFGIAGLISTPDEEAPVAKALPVVPNLLLKPLIPLSIEELSGDTLPLKISGIKDRTVIDAPAVAFWGDTAPDAFVTVNGKQVEVSEYGAFVIDYPLDDGANFIEVLASDFQGRTTRVSFTVVRTQ